MKYVSDSVVFPKRQGDGSGYRVPIPNYHRAAVGIFPGTKLFLLPIPMTRDLIVTSIEPERWGDLWRLEVVLRDTPGAARSIVETLVQHNVNILLQEGLSDYGFDRRSAHQVFLVLDLHDYYSDIDGDTLHRNTVTRPGVRPNHLITNLLSHAIDFLQTTPGEDRWNFRFERMEFFYRHKEHRTRAEVHLLSEGRSILVPNQIVHQNIFVDKVPEKVACHILSDTEEKYIKLRFLTEDRQYLLLRIAHAERVGAILSFMNLLKKVRANIVNSYSRLASISKIAIWYAFLEMPAGFGSDDLAGTLKELDGLKDVESFTIRSFYGFSYDPQQLAEKLRLENYERRYERHAKKRVKRRRTPAPKPTAEDRALDARPFYLDRKWKRRRSTVFVAMPFDEQYEEFYREHIQETIQSCGLRAARVDKEDIPNPNVPIIEMIREYIATCDFMVADVTRYNANVVYEVGLAHAINKRVLFLCEDRYKDEAGLLFDLQSYYHLFYSPYKSSSFDESFRKVIVAMRDVSV